MSDRPALTRKASDEMVTLGEGGIHINHMADHHHVSVDGAMGTHHSFATEEAVAFSNLINGQLENDQVAAHFLPLEPSSDDIFKKQVDGLILARLINIAQPGTIDEKKLNKHVDGREMSVFQRNENLNVVVNAAKAIGCHVVNIGAQDISEGHPIPILGLIWQIFRIGVVSNICLDGHPELVLLLQPGESLAAIAKLSPEQLLLRWVRYNLGRANESFKVNSFNDFGKPELFLSLLNQLNPEISKVIGSGEAPIDIAQRVIDAANLVGVKTFLQAADLLLNNPRLSLGFVAQIFNAVGGLSADLEVNVFAAYVNYRLRASVHVTHLIPLNVNSNDLYLRQYDGFILAELLRDFRESALDITALTKGELDREGQISNMNKVIEAATRAGANFDGFTAEDLVSGQPKSVLGAIWQLIRLKLLGDLNLQRHPELIQLADQDGGDDLSALSPEDLLRKWVNHHLRKAGVPVKEGAAEPVNNFEADLRDPSIFGKLLDQLASVTAAKGDADNTNNGDGRSVGDANTASDASGANAVSAAKGAAGSDNSAPDNLAVAADVLDKAKALGVDTQLVPADLVSDNPHVGVLFAAQIFNACTGLRVPVSAETVAFSAYVNSALAGQNDVSCCVPIDLNSNDLYAVVARGRVLAALLNEVKPNTVDLNRFSGERSRDEKIAHIADLLATIRGAFGHQFISVDIDAAAVVDASADSPTAALELLLVIIKIRLVAYLTSINLTVVRAVASSSEVSATSASAEQVLLGWLGAHLATSKSPLILAPNASPKL